MARAHPGILAHQRADGNEEHILLQREVTTLGRSDTCDVVVNNAKVSRLHARIELQNERYVLSDAGSRNGTMVNGQSITTGHLLATGDEIWLASRDVVLRFTDPEETMMLPIANVPPALYIDEQARTVQVYGVESPLSPLEYRMLRYLAANAGKVCSREDCFLAVWGQPYDHSTCEDALNTCMAKLRRNLRSTAEMVGNEPPQITTIQRVGFRLDTSATFAPSDSEKSVLQEHTRS
jgi:DNA-binding response OmpR family regulator